MYSGSAIAIEEAYLLGELVSQVARLADLPVAVRRHEAIHVRLTTGLKQEAVRSYSA